MDYQMIIDCLLITTCIVYITDISKAQSTMFTKLQRWIFNDIEPKELCYVLNCSQCLSFWIILIFLICNNCSYLFILCVSCLCSFLSLFIREILLLIEELFIKLMNKIQ